MDGEKRILQVSEMVAENLLEAMLDFRHGTAQTNSLWEALEILNPHMSKVDELIESMCDKHRIGAALINDAQNTNATGGYIVGIIAGLHMAGKADLVPRLAKLYAECTGDDRYPLYDEDGNWISQEDFKLIKGGRKNEAGPPSPLKSRAAGQSQGRI